MQGPAGWAGPPGGGHVSGRSEWRAGPPVRRPGAADCPRRPGVGAQGTRNPRGLLSRCVWLSGLLSCRVWRAVWMPPRQPAPAGRLAQAAPPKLMWWAGPDQSACLRGPRMSPTHDRDAYSLSQHRCAGCCHQRRVAAQAASAGCTTPLFCRTRAGCCQLAARCTRCGLPSCPVGHPRCHAHATGTHRHCAIAATGCPASHRLPLLSSPRSLLLPADRHGRHRPRVTGVDPLVHVQPGCVDGCRLPPASGSSLSPMSPPPLINPHPTFFQADMAPTRLCARRNCAAPTTTCAAG